MISVTEQILIAFVCVFAVIGVLTVLYSAIDALWDNNNAAETELVMFVKDREENIEGAVRSIVRAVTATSESIKPSAIIAVDCGSTDETRAILESMTDENELLKYCTKDEYIDYVKSL